MASKARKRVNAWMRLSARAFKRPDRLFLDGSKRRTEAKLFNDYQRGPQYARDLMTLGMVKKARQLMSKRKAESQSAA